ncbi:MAG: phosphatidylglycerol lysyltransferase domain-containing protein, partial [Clostridiales bacterium]
MDFYPITLQDKKLFDNFLAGRHHDLITYNFTNLFLWRQWCRFSWQIINDTLCINSDYNNQNMMLVPISPNDTLVLQTTEILMDYYRHTQTPFILTEVSQTMLDLYEHHWPGRFQAIAHRDEANYIYNRQDLAQLIGKRYNSKRNHVNRFEREYPNYQFVPLTKDLIPRCKERQTFWRLSHGATDIELILEEQGVLDALNHFEELG